MSRRRDGFAGWSPEFARSPYWSDPVIPPDIARDRCACLVCAGTTGLCNLPAREGDRLCEECARGHGKKSQVDD